MVCGPNEIHGRDESLFHLERHSAYTWRQTNKNRHLKSGACLNICAASFAIGPATGRHGASRACKCDAPRCMNAIQDPLAPRRAESLAKPTNGETHAPLPIGFVVWERSCDKILSMSPLFGKGCDTKNAIGWKGQISKSIFKIFFQQKNPRKNALSNRIRKPIKRKVQAKTPFRIGFETFGFASKLVLEEWST